MLKKMWEIMYFTHDVDEPTEYFDDLYDECLTLTTKVTPSLAGEARAELNQVMSMANPLQLEELYNTVLQHRGEVESALGRLIIHAALRAINDKPEIKFVKPTSDEETWIATQEKFLLDEEYVDYYLESVVNLHLMPEFKEITDRVIRLFEAGQKRHLLFTPGEDNFDSHIKDQGRFDKAIAGLIDRDLVRQDGAELFWLGIGASMVGSSAALARYLEEAGIMRHFGVLVKGQRAYKQKFNIQGTDKEEWNSRYSHKGDKYIRFDSVDIDYSDQLSFILDLE